MILGWSLDRILLQRIPRGFWVGSSMQDPGVDSAIDSDSDFMISGVDSEDDSGVDSEDDSGVDSGSDLL